MNEHNSEENDYMESSRMAVTGHNEEKRVEMDGIGLKEKLCGSGENLLPSQRGSLIGSHQAQEDRIPILPSASTSNTSPATTRKASPETRQTRRKAEKRSVMTLTILRGMKAAMTEKGGYE